MTHPRITVITPCHNQAPFVERAVCSVLDQGYPNLEYLVIDGGSTDGTRQVLALYRDRITLVRQEGDSPAAALNEGMRRATGDIVGVLPAEDLYLPGTLSDVARWLDAKHAQPWVAGHCLRIDEHDRLCGQDHPWEAPITAPAASLATLLMHDVEPPALAASFWRRSLLQEAGAFDASLAYAYDFEMACRLLSRHQVPLPVPHRLAAQRQPTAGRSTHDPVTQGVEYVEVARKYADQLPLSQRYKLWRNCDQRQRIYALARAEMQGNEGRRMLWHQLLARPWWLANAGLRRTLLSGRRSAAVEAGLSLAGARRRVA